MKKYIQDWHYDVATLDEDLRVALLAYGDDLNALIREVEAASARSKERHRLALNALNERRLK